MSLSKFAKTGSAAPGKPSGSKFGAAPAPRAAAPSKFGARQAPEPEPEEEEEEEQQPEPQRGGAGKFGRTANAPPQARGRAQQRGGGGGGQRVHVPSRGRYTGTRSKAPRPPFLESGKHICKILKTYESYKPGRGPRLNIHLEIIESSDPINQPGDVRTVGYNTDDAAFAATAGDIFSFVRAGAGFATDAEFLAVFVDDSDQDLIDAVHGNPEAQKEIGPNGQPYGENPLEGQIVEAFGSRGNMVGETQFYNFQWSPAEAF